VLGNQPPDVRVGYPPPPLPVLFLSAFSSHGFRSDCQLSISSLISMKSRFQHQLPGLRSPGFFTRLANIIIIQIIFVFAAVALLIFFPQQSNRIYSDLALPRPELRAIAEKAGSLLKQQLSPADDFVDNEKIRSLLFPLFLEEQIITEADIFVPIGDDGFVPIYAFRRPEQTRSAESSDHDLSRVVNASIVLLELRQPDALPISSICCSKHLVHYYPFDVSANLPAVLVAITEHNLVISERSQLVYALFLLFLCSALVSLLIVYLISRRFKEPLDQLIHGFEKTADGELYYLFEKKGDTELKKLVGAFNRMSETLWQNHRKLKQSNFDLANANLAFLESQLFLATLIDSSPGCIVAADSEGRIMIFNHEASQVFGYGKEEAIGKNVEELFTNAARESRVYRPSGGNQSGAEVLCRRRDGSTFPAYLIASSVVIRDSSAPAYLYIIRDISESKSFQQMMIRLDRYYTRGQMAGEIAHEINNYLAVLSGNIELMPLLLKKGNIDKAGQRLEVMKKTVDKIVRFTDGLIDVHPDEAGFELADINQLVENTIAFLKPQNKFDAVEIATMLSPDLSLVEIDVGQIQQLLVNLLYNSAEALKHQPEQKKIWITTSVVGEESEKSAQVEVKDNGPGVAEGKEQALFVERFTTERKGQGIGLITCRKIVEAHNGKIAYRKEGGAVFSFTISMKRPYTSSDTTSEILAQQSLTQPA